MDANDKKLKFILAMTKHGLQHFDGGGVISASGTNPLTGIAGGLTVQNRYNAGAPTSTEAIGAQQAQLANILGTEAAGGGPNPAQMQYLQNAQNIAQQQAANYAQNRSLNPGLAARMAGQTAAATTQSAANQAAVQQAQQQLAAQQQMAALTGIEQQGLSSAQGINAQIAQNNANAVNAQQQGILGSIASGAGSALNTFGIKLADGGEVEMPAQYMADGGKPIIAGSIVTPDAPMFSNAESVKDTYKDRAEKNKSSLGSGFNLFSSPFMSEMPTGAADLGPGAAGATSDLGMMAAMVAKGGQMHKAGHQSMLGQFYSKAYGGAANDNLMRLGGPVKAEMPSQKAVVKNDSYANDKIPAMLSEGEIVIPRHIAMHPNAPKKSAEFVAAVLAKKKVGKK